VAGVTIEEQVEHALRVLVRPTPEGRAWLWERIRERVACSNARAYVFPADEYEDGLCTVLRVEYSDRYKPFLVEINYGDLTVTEYYMLNWDGQDPPTVEGGSPS
jgi:hypothetical protein